MITNLMPIQTGQTIDATPHRLNFGTIASEYNTHDRNNYGVHGLGINDSIATVSFYTELLEKNKPIGTVIPIWDNDILQIQELVDTDIWTIMDGKTISDIDSPFNNIEIPDLSEAYLVCKTGSGINKNKNSTHTRSFSHIHDFTQTHAHSFLHGNHSFGSHAHSVNRDIPTPIYWNSEGLWWPKDTNSFYSVETQWTSTHKKRMGGSNAGFTSGVKNVNRINANITTTTSSSSETLQEQTITTYGGNISETKSTPFDNNTLDMSSISVKPRSIKCRYYLRYK